MEGNTDNPNPKAPETVPPAPTPIKAFSPLQRIEVLEAQAKNMQSFIQGMDTVVKDMDSKVNAAVGFTAALGRLLREKRELTEDNLNRAGLDNRIDAMRVPIKRLLDEGRIAPCECVTATSLLVFRESKSDTGEVTSERSQLGVDNFVKPIRGKLLGMRVGDKIEPLPGAGVVFEALEIYDLVAPAQTKEAEPPAPPPAPAPEAPAAKEAEPPAKQE